jgi:hypothetical protein
MLLAAIIFSIKPDHLSLLIDTIGVCIRGARKIQNCVRTFVVEKTMIGEIAVAVITCYLPGGVYTC